MDIRTAVTAIKDILVTTPEKEKELRDVIARMYFSYRDTNYKEFILSLLRFVGSPKERFEQFYMSALLVKRVHTDVPKELEEYLTHNNTIKTSSSAPSLIQATTKESLFAEELPAPKRCILFIRQEDPEFFKKAPSIISQFSKLPVYRLTDSLFSDPSLPLFNVNNPPYEHAFFWTDRYYLNNQGRKFSSSIPLVEDNKVIGPILIDTALFKKHYDAIMQYDDIAYGYLKETDTLIEGNSNVFILNRKVCCSTAREMYSKDIIYIPDEGKEFLHTVRWLHEKIQGGK